MNHHSQYINNETISDNSINQYDYIFNCYINDKPSLEDALTQMFLSSGLLKHKSEELINLIKSKVDKHLKANFGKIQKKYKKITYEDAQIISSYTCELSNYDYNPYKILNTNLVENDRENGIKKVSKYLFIFLSALRKLDRYPKKNPKNEKIYLYRCINAQVEYKYDPFDKNKIPYLRGQKKMFWPFSSASNNPETSFSFLGKDKNNIKNGTIFTLTGNIWGYDITLFNIFKEKEILLEPERELIIKETIPPVNGIVYVRCKILDTPVVLENIINNNKLNSEIEENFNINQFLDEHEKKNKININIFPSSTKNEKHSQHINYNIINTEPNSPHKFIPVNSKKLLISKSEQNLLQKNDIFDNDKINKIEDTPNFLKHKKFLSINNDKILNKNNSNNLLPNKKFNTIDNDSNCSKKISISKKINIDKNINNLKEDEIQIGNYILYRNKKLCKANEKYDLYYGRDIKRKEEVAITLEKKGCLNPTLFEEAKIYKKLQGGLGIPKLRWYGEQGNCNILITDLLDHSLLYYFESCKCKFSLLTTLMLVDQMLSIIEFIHNKEFIHCNINIYKFFMGRGYKCYNVYITSFYKAERYIDSITKLHKPYKDGIKFSGNVTFSSINQLCGKEPSRRDDIESLGYILVYFFKGKLPWISIKTKNDAIKKKAAIKIRTSLDVLCENCPNQFKNFIEYARNLKFEEKPNYKYLRNLLRQICIENKLIYDYTKFDWKLKK